MPELAQLPVVDVVGVGLNATDTIICLPYFPSFDSKVEFLSTQVRAGGQTAGAMVACQFWGLQTRYVGKVGEDGAAGFQRREMEQAGVEAHFLTATDCSSQSAYILVDEKSGERTILWKRDPRLAIYPEELKHEWVVRARALLVDGHDTAAAAEAARWAREAGLPVVADLDNLYGGVEALLENVDYLWASRDFPQRLTVEGDLLSALRRIRERYGCRLTGATLGAGGALAWDGTQFHYSPAYRVQAVDTTGAGDIFHGAFVYALLQGWPTGRALDFSCAAAALNCMALGARGGIRPVEEIERLMQEGARHPAMYDAGRLGAQAAG